jgi:hypothetical protein
MLGIRRPPAMDGADASSDGRKEIEIPVLRHQLAVLRRRTPRPRMNWPDCALIATLTWLLPVH